MITFPITFLSFISSNQTTATGLACIQILSLVTQYSLYVSEYSESLLKTSLLKRFPQFSVGSDLCSPFSLSIFWLKKTFPALSQFYTKGNLERVTANRFVFLFSSVRHTILSKTFTPYPSFVISIKTFSASRSQTVGSTNIIFLRLPHRNVAFVHRHCTWQTLSLFYKCVGANVPKLSNKEFQEPFLRWVIGITNL